MGILFACEHPHMNAGMCGWIGTCVRTCMQPARLYGHTKPQGCVGGPGGGIDRPKKKSFCNGGTEKKIDLKISAQESVDNWL